MLKPRISTSIAVLKLKYEGRPKRATIGGRSPDVRRVRGTAEDAIVGVDCLANRFHGGVFELTRHRRLEGDGDLAEVLPELSGGAPLLVGGAGDGVDRARVAR